MLFIGEQGKILCDFRGNKPRLIPQSRQRAFEGTVVAKEFDATTPDDEWVKAIKNGREVERQLRGSRAAGRGGHACQYRAARALQAAVVECAGQDVHEFRRKRPPSCVASNIARDGTP